MRPGPRSQVKSREWPAFIFALSIIGVFLLACFAGASKTADASGADGQFRVVSIVEGLERPWSLAFLPGGDMLVTEKAGRLRRISGGQLLVEPLEGVPVVADHGQGGLLDVVLHPDFKSNRLVYISYSAKGDGGYGTEVARGVLHDAGLEDVEVIFRALPKTRSGHHFGSRMVFDAEEHLFVTVGDRGNRDNAQDLSTHSGSVMRLNADGSVPADNPFVGKQGVATEIYSYGHRNPQGMTRDPATGRIWIHEHGPQGGDEINLLVAGANFGWPVVTFGEEYGGGAIGEGKHKDGLIDPLWVWVPSIAPSGLAFYSADRFKQWSGSLIGGALKSQLMFRLSLDNATVTAEERFLSGDLGRIRDVRQGPDGYLYLLTDARNGSVVRLEPTN